MRKRLYDFQFGDGMGLARERAALDRCSDHPSPARAWLVDDAYDAAARSSRQLRVAFRARLRSAGIANPAAVVAMAQSGAGAASQSQTVGAGGGACWAHSPLYRHVPRVSDRLDGRHDVPRPY